MKKIAVCLTLICTVLFNLAAKSQFNNSSNSKKTVEIFTDVNDISPSEQKWLGVTIADKLEANLFAYADFSFINGVNKKQIIDIQREYEGLAYDESAALEVGNLSTASYGIFLTIKKGGSKYSLTIRFTDLSTGESLATVHGTSNNPEELYAGNGSVIDKLTIDLCEALNIILTPSEKYIIMNGEKDLSADERTKIYDEKIRLFQKQVEEIDQKIEYVTLSGDVNADTYKYQLETEKKIADEKLRMARENQRRAEEQAENERQAQERNAQFSVQQRENIESITVELQDKYKILREKKLENEPILGRIKIIELKKKALLETQGKIDAEVKELNFQANSKIKEKKNQIMNAPISVVEQGDSPNTLSKVAYENRMRDYEAEREKIIDYYKDLEKNLNEKIANDNKALLNEIHKNYNELKNVVVSSLSDDLIVNYGNYDGNKGGWPLYITVKSDDTIIFTTTSFLSYKELTGKEPISDNRDPNFDDFSLNVNTYENLFLRGEPILTYEIEYTVSPYAPDYPSKYKFKFNYLKYYDTRKTSMWNGKLRASKTGFLYLDQNSVTRQFHPLYDISAIELNQTGTIKIDNVAYESNDYDNRYEEKKSKKEDSIRVVEEYDDHDDYDSDNDFLGSWPSPHSLLGVNFGFGLNGIKGPSVEVEADIGLFDFFYLGLSLTTFFPEEIAGYYVVPDSSFLMVPQFRFGVNVDLFLCNIYCAVGVGANYFVNDSYSTSTSYSDTTTEDNDLKFSYSFEFGGNIPFTNEVAISCAYTMIFYDNNEHEFDNIDFGIAVTF